jgi:hypothetical protein
VSSSSLTVNYLTDIISQRVHHKHHTPKISCSVRFKL